MNSPDFEQRIGIELFWTDEPGFGGKLRTYPEDFHVTELFLYPPKTEDGRFVIAESPARTGRQTRLSMNSRIVCMSRSDVSVSREQRINDPTAPN